MNNQIKKHFDRSISTYKKAAVVQKRVAADCCARIPEGYYPRVLEVGAGGGLLAEYFLQSHMDFEIYAAVDISARMLKLVPRDRVIPVQADGENAPFKPGCFDLLLSSSTMQWYRKAPASILDNIGMLRRGGFFSLAIFVQGTFKQMARVAAATGFGSLYPLPAAQSLVDCLEGAGQSHESALEEHTLYFSSVRQFLHNHKRTGATYTRPEAGFGKRVYKDFSRMYEDTYAEEKGVPVTYRVLYLWGRR